MWILVDMLDGPEPEKYCIISRHYSVCRAVVARARILKKAYQKNNFPKIEIYNLETILGLRSARLTAEQAQDMVEDHSARYEMGEFK